MADSAPKVMSMHAAIAAHVHDGDTVVIEGFTHLICFAAGHEIIRQGRTNLTLARLTPDLIRSEEHTSELQSLAYLVCRLLLEKKNLADVPIDRVLDRNDARDRLSRGDRLERLA